MGCWHSLDIDIDKSLWLVTAQSFARKFKNTPFAINMTHVYKDVDVYVGPYYPYFFKPRGASVALYRRETVAEPQLSKDRPPEEIEIVGEEARDCKSQGSTETKTSEKTKWYMTESLRHWSHGVGEYKVDDAQIYGTYVDLTFRSVSEPRFGFVLHVSYDALKRDQTKITDKDEDVYPSVYIFGAWNGGGLNPKDELWRSLRFDKIQKVFEHLYRDLLRLSGNVSTPVAPMLSHLPQAVQAADPRASVSVGQKQLTS